MNVSELRERLRDTPVPGGRDAEERAWRVVRAALDRREPVRAPSYRIRYALAAAAVIVLAAIALTPPGAAIGRWIRDVVHPGRGHARPGLSSLPAPGRLLVTSGRGPWIVRRDGSKRLLGAYDDADWSPHGRFVVATRGRQLVALEPGGTVRWSLARPDPVSDARWSPSGFRIAYLAGPRSGYERAPTAPPGARRSLRVVAGDGTGDRPLVKSVAEVAPAWSPAALHVLAYSDRRGRIHVVAVDNGRRLWRSAAAAPPVQLAWSADGRRLLAVGRRSTRVFDARGRLLRTVATPARIPEAAPVAAFATKGHEFALARESRLAGQSEVVVLDAERRGGPPRRVFAGAGAFDALAWSPDGRWLLVSWPSAGQWLFIRSADVSRIVAVSSISRQFDPGGTLPEIPNIDGWCCPP